MIIYLWVWFIVFDNGEVLIKDIDLIISKLVIGEMF